MLRHKGGYRQYAAVKRQWHATVALLAQVARTPSFEAAHVRFEWVEPNRRRDPSNVCGGGTKILLDALQHAGVLKNDGWKQVLSLSHRWRVDAANPGVLVTLLSR